MILPTAFVKNLSVGIFDQINSVSLQHKYNITTKLMSRNFPEVVVVGSCMIDFVSYSQRIPKLGETIKGKKFVTNFGGKGANQCIAAARLGAKTAMVGRVGSDVWGDRYLENFKKENVDIKYVKQAKDSESGIAQITVNEDGLGQIIIIPGANDALTEEDIQAASEIISNALVLVMQLETPQRAAIKAMQLCKGITILNAAPATTEYDPELLTLPSIFCVNETEAETFSSLPVTDVDGAIKAGKALISKGCNSVVITLGENGCVYVDKKNEVIKVKSPKIEPVDSTGAGDAFVGALAYMMCQGSDYPISKALDIACQVAADSVTRPGTQNSYPDQSILKKLKVI